jgi:tight adherence protein C
MVLPSLLTGLLVTLSMICVWQSLKATRPSEGILEKLEQLQVEQLPGTQQILEEAELQLSFFARIIKPLLWKLVSAAGRLMPQRNMERLRRDMIAAGNPYGLSATDVLGIKFLTALAAGVLMLLFIRAASSGVMSLFSLALVPLGFYLPNFWLHRRISARKIEIVRALPDALDMLTVCVDAGLGFDASLLKLSDKWQNALSMEFARVVAEMRVGVARRQALRNLVARCDVPDLSNFVAVIIQADELGLSIANILHIQSQQLRQRRRQRAEEQARKAPIKMLFPLVFLIFPAIFAVVFGPAVPLLLETFSQVSM